MAIGRTRPLGTKRTPPETPLGPSPRDQALSRLVEIVSFGGIATPTGTLAPGRRCDPDPPARAVPKLFSGQKRRHLARLRRGTRFFVSDKVAAAHMIYFLVSAALFLPLIGGMLYFMRDVTDSQIQEDAGLEPKARNLLERLVGSPGALGNGTTFWQNRTDGTDALVEAGIRHDLDRLRLSQEKLGNLQRGSIEHNIDTLFVDYPELKNATGLDDRFDFHLQLTPIGFDKGVDPYGTRALANAHVAYIAEYDDDPPGDFEGAYGELEPQARKEIDALEALGLDYKAGEEGFTNVPYFPNTCELGLPEEDLQHGTVVADTSTLVRSHPRGADCSDQEDQSYRHWFLQNYFFTSSGEYRFDALVFGNGVSLQEWIDAADHADIGKELFLDYVQSGGTVIFMDSDGGTGGDDFVTKCAAAESHCLFSETGELEALKVPDENNHILSAPNRIPSDLVQRTDPWNVWNDQNTPLNESHGFIPVKVDTPIWTEVEATAPIEHMNVHLGATTSDRYGDEGGTVILANWDLTSADDDDVSRVFSNLLNYGLLRTAYLDYGPEVPEDRAVRASSTNTVLELPNGEVIEVRMQLFIWRS